MNLPFIHRTGALTLCLILFAAMIVMVVMGRFVRKYWWREETETKGGINSLLTAMYALFGFILAFTFGMSGARYENVRNAIVDEANSIGTAILRSDLYSDSVRAAFRADFRDYVKARISYYDNVADTALFFQSRRNIAKAGSSLWARAAQQSKLPNMLIPSNQMVPALNEMFDLATSREVLLKARVPDVIIYMLFILALTTSFIGGFTSPIIGRKDWIVVVTFSLLTAMVIYITLDLGRPLRGVIKADWGQEAVANLRTMFD
jgi:uncharacterized membrane protein